MSDEIKAGDLVLPGDRLSGWWNSGGAYFAVPPNTPMTVVEVEGHGTLRVALLDKEVRLPVSWVKKAHPLELIALEADAGTADDQ